MKMLYRKSELAEKCKAAEQKVHEIENEITERQSRGKRLVRFVETMRGLGESQADFDEGIWNELVDFVTVKSKKEMVFTFFDGTEVTGEV